MAAGPAGAQGHRHHQGRLRHPKISSPPPRLGISCLVWDPIVLLAANGGVRFLEENKAVSA